MTDKYIYTQPFTEEIQATSERSISRQLLSEGVLSDGPAQVESVTSNAPTRTITLQFSGEYSRLTALEYDELAEAGAIDALPYYTPGSASDPESRYVALETADSNPAHPTTDKVQRVDITLSVKGSQRTHVRAVRTNVSDVTTPFASSGAAEIVIPGPHTNPRWWDPVGGTVEDASPTGFNTGQYTDLAVYDATQSSITDPVLVYELKYRYEYQGDVAVWDSTTADKTDAAGNVQWQRVFSTAHEYANTPTIETKRLRLKFDEGFNISAFEWDDSAGEYQSLALGTSDWRLGKINIERIGLERVDGYMRMFDSANTSNKYTLNFSAHRGYNGLYFTERQGEGSFPQGVIDRLDPIAHDSATSPVPDLDLVTRPEVNL